MDNDLKQHLTVDEAAMLEAAEVATEGKWEHRHIGYGHSHEVVRRPSGAPGDGGDIISMSWQERDAAHIATANPAAVIALLTALAEERRRYQSLSDEMHQRFLTEQD